MNGKAYEIMLNGYRESCRDFYEVRYGEKLNVSYTIKNNHTGEEVNGTVSGCRIDEKLNRTMRTIRKMMISIYGDQVIETLDEIRKEERKKEKEFFKENPQFICYVTDVK